MTRRVVAAIDIGASSGRVMAGIIDGTRIELDPVHRFPNGVTEIDGHLRWNLTALYAEVLDGLGMLAERYPEVESIGIDTWAVDYGLLDADGRLLAEPISYRDGRTDADITDRVHTTIPPPELYAINGLQFLPFNTIYQLAAEQQASSWQRAHTVVMLPDLIAYWLTDRLATEYTNATSTGLVDTHSRSWSTELLDRLDIDPALLAPIEQPGSTRGKLAQSMTQRTGLDPSVLVITVGSHDTASAVVGIPMTQANSAFIVSGTWSLVGLELDAPVTTNDAFAANFTNEGGVDGRIRFLRNVGGLWPLQECLRTWSDEGRPVELAEIIARAASLPSGGPVFEIDSNEFIAPGNMPERVAAAVAASGQPIPSSSAEIVRCVMDSLAAAYASTLRCAAELSGRMIDHIHIVGGGSQNELLCQLTANATGLPVIAGPIEATALGNVAVQARAIGAALNDLAAIRQMIATSSTLRTYQPR